MDVVDKGGIGRDITDCTFGTTVSFCIIFVVFLHFGFVVAQVVRNEDTDVAVVMHEAATFGKTADDIRQGERGMTAFQFIAVDEAKRVITGDRTCSTRFGIRRSRVSENDVLQTTGRYLDVRILQILLQPNLILNLPIHPLVLLATEKRQGCQEKGKYLYFAIHNSGFNMFLSWYIWK